MSRTASITSADNPRFRELLGLAESARDRHQAGLALLDGVHLIHACRQAGRVPRDLILSASASQSAEIVGAVSAFPDIEPLVLTDKLFQRLSSVKTATGILAVLPVVRPTLRPDATPTCVLLEDIQDPGNLGSILRSAAAAGLTTVLLSRKCADAWSPRVLRAAMGAHFQLEIHEDVDLLQFAGDYPGLVIALDQQGAADLYGTDLRGRIGFLLGNEGAGISPDLRAAAGATVMIPMPGAAAGQDGRPAVIESLGVAAAAAVCLFERARQLSGARTDSQLDNAPQLGRPNNPRTT